MYFMLEFCDFIKMKLRRGELYLTKEELLNCCSQLLFKDNYMKKITLILALLILTPLIGQVIINEYSASNLYEYTDNYNMEEDWIELYNTSENEMDISGYFLSDT